MTRQDPGHTSGTTAGYAPLPDCRCGHRATSHDRHGRARSSPCHTANPQPCGCTSYEPKEDHR